MNKKKFKVIISIITLIINLYCLFIFSNMYNSHYIPTMPKTDIASILRNPELSQEDYSLLYSQTGLSKIAIDELLSQENGLKQILDFQTNYYTKQRIYIEKLNFFTSQENLMVSSANTNKDSKIAPLKNGDILFTKSTHTLYWRHGHCGIVIDAKKGITLESLEPGTISMLQDISKWEAYSTLKVMRLKNVEQKKLDEIAQYAAKNLIDIDYSIFASKKHKLEPKTVNCSQIIYQAFIHFGLDLDSNSGIFVTPENIAKSKLLEVVQIYGFNPEKDW